MTGAWTKSVAFLTVAGLAAVVGCGKSDPFDRQAISGTVTLKGQTVKVGQIFFEPAAGQGTGTNAGITDGKFALTKAQGLSPGKYTWRLLVLDRIPSGEPGGADVGGPTPKNLVPAKENGKEFEVKAGAENKLDIAIP